MPLPHVQSPFLTPGEAAAWLRSKERTLERWRGQGTGPPFMRLGRRVFYRLEGLESWVARHVEPQCLAAAEPRCE